MLFLHQLISHFFLLYPVDMVCYIDFSVGFIFRAVSGSLSTRLQRFATCPTCTQFPSMSIFCRSGMFVTTNLPTLTHHCHPKFTVTLKLSLGFVYSMDLDKYIMMCMDHYTVLQNSSTALKISVLCLFMSLSQPVAMTGTLTTSIILHFHDVI